ncbi:MAG: winged helix DNA-binding domain-containing protein, partial [Bifidobacteriaceae bacterium]|nr:winged helix DNA-binding domain-containing protein [Bifidobacteriaceae bacterium]
MAAGLSLREARRIALRAQRFGAGRAAAASQRRVGGIIRRLGQFQIDSVNVFTRAHAMPLFSRLGQYNPERLEDSGLFEYWGHAASLIDIELYPCFEFRRQEARQWAWGRMRQLLDDQPELIDAVLDQVAGRGAGAPRPIDHRPPQAARGGGPGGEAHTAQGW